MSKPLSKIYANYEITNTGKTLSIPASFNKHFAQPILDKSDDYCMVINKFSMDTEGIPVSVIELKQPQTPKTSNFETIHNVYMADSSGNIATANILFNTGPVKNIPPSPAKKNTDGTVYYNNKDPYFFIYHYRIILKMINDAIANTFNQLFPSSTESSPQFIFDPTTQLITLYAPIDLFQYGQPNIAKLYFSMSLNKYIGEGFPTSYVYPGFIPGINEPTFTINIFNNGHNTQNNLIALIQEYTSMTSFSSVSAIIIRSSKLPVRKEFFPGNSHPYLLYDINSVDSSYTNMSAFPIISVYYPSSTKAGDFRSKIIYSTDSIEDGSTMDLIGNKELRDIDLEVCWVDNYNNIYPLTLFPGKQVMIKLCFIKKSE